MKQLNKFSKVLKVAGIVLILVSVVLWIYSLANTGSPWNTLKNALNSVDEGTNLADRLAFDNSYFKAMSRAAANRDLEPEARAQEIRPYFERWFSRLEAGFEKRKAAVREESLRWLNEEFDASAFLTRLESLEDMQDSQELREIFDYINALAAPPKKGKVAKLQAASQEPWFKEYYEAFTAEHGAEGGTWFEFMSAVKVMLEEEAAAGNAVKDVKAWMGSSFNYDTYLTKLSQVRESERAEMTDNFSISLGALLTKKQAGETVDFAPLIRDTAAAVAAKYPDQNLGGDLDTETAFATIMPSLLESQTFDGSYQAIADALRTRASKETGSAAEGWEQNYLNTTIIAEADKRATIGIVSGFWAVVARYLLMLCIGIALLLIAWGIKTAVSRHLLAQRKDAGIQEDPDVLLRVEHLKQYFKGGGGVTKAVDDVSFQIKRGEVFGLVGESGCGKTTTGRTIINLYDPTEGDVYFDGLRISSSQNGLPVLKAQLRQDYNALINEAQKAGKQDEAERLQKELKEKLIKAEDNALESAVEKEKCVQLYRERRLKKLKEAYEADMAKLSGAAAQERTRRYETERRVAAKDNVMTRMQMIFQDPIASINPRMTVREIIAEGLIIRGIKDKEYINNKVNEMLELVGLVREHADRYPHEFSGGQRQRIGIARAIIMEPDLIIADEPISALDVSIQAQIINLLNDLRERMGLTIMFIAHNLSVVKYFSDRIAVMYFGHIVEMASSDELFAHPLHPYTVSLLSAIPLPDPVSEKQRVRIRYDPLTAHDYSVDKPSFREITPGHFVQCNDAEFAQYRRQLDLEGNA